MLGLQSCHIIVCDFSHTLLVLLAMFRVLMGHYIGISTSRVCAFRLGWAFALFPWLTQLQPAKLIAIIFSLTPITSKVCVDEQPRVL